MFSMPHASLLCFSGKSERTRPFGATVWCYISRLASSIQRLQAAVPPTCPRRHTRSSKIRLPIINLAGQFRDGAQAKRRYHFTFIPSAAFQAQNLFMGDLCRARAPHRSPHRPDIEQVFFLQPPHWKARSDGMTRLLRCQHKLLPTVCRPCVSSRRASYL